MESSRFLFLMVCLGAGILETVKGEVPALFILGDSTADVGTNNFLPGNRAKADFLPYGIDFPHSRPTGRFSNGFNAADFLAMKFGFNRSPPPYLLLAQNPILSFRGANFASGGSGILDSTGQSAAANDLKNVVPLREQIQQMSTVHLSLAATKGLATAQNFIAKSLFVISVGSNDIIEYFYSKSAVPKEQFIANLGLAYEYHLRNLVKIGARKIGIISVPPIGCCPSLRVYNTSGGGCAERLNELATDFYSKIKTMMMKLSSEYKDLKYSLANTYEMTMNVIQNPHSFGFVNVQNACCGNQTSSGPSACGPKSSLCPTRHYYLFWDMVHPTDAASKLAAGTLYSGPPQYVAPINFKQLGDA